MLPFLPRRQIIIEIITTTINPSEFRNQNIRFPTNHCERCTVCNANIIVFHDITQLPRDNTHDFESTIVHTCSCIRSSRRCRARLFRVTPRPRPVDYLLSRPIDCPSSGAEAVVVRPESRILFYI